jgi:molybdopterin molybdotransferase
MKSIGEAQREIVGCFEPIGIERLPLLQAAGRWLAEGVHARVDLPRFDSSAMDGYAVRHADLSTGCLLKLVGEARAGGAWPEPLLPGTATRIFTGAPTPAGADTVVIQENTQREAATVRIERVPDAGANVRRRGTDLRALSLALPRGERLAPGEIGLLAAQGEHAATVYRRPRVAIVSTGDELRDIGHDDAPGTVVGSNAYSLAAQVMEAGAEPWVLPAVPDRLDDIASTLGQALRADVVLSSGGVSVGEHDLVGRALERLGIAVRLWKVAIKPGKPLMFALSGRTPIVGLPGNPVSALVTFEVFVKPGLRRMLGDDAPYPELIDVRLERDHRHGTGRTELARARLVRGGDGAPFARLHELQGSGSLPSMCGVDALVVLDAEVEHFAAGSSLRALPLRQDRGQREPQFV